MPMHRSLSTKTMKDHKASSFDSAAFNRTVAYFELLACEMNLLASLTTVQDEQLATFLQNSTTTLISYA